MIKGRRKINARFSSYTRIFQFDFLQNQQIDVAFNTGLVYKIGPQLQHCSNRAAPSFR